MAFAAVSCLIETLEDLLRFTFLALDINSLQVKIQGKQPVDNFIRDFVRRAATNMLRPLFLKRGTHLYLPLARSQKEGSPGYDDSLKTLYFLKIRGSEIADLWRVLGYFLIFLKDFGNIYHDREKMQYLERSLTDLAYRIEGTIEEIVFDCSIISKAFNFVNAMLNEDPMSVMGEFSFTTEILDMSDKWCGIQLNLQQALREVDLLKEEVRNIYDETPVVNVDLQLGRRSGIADLLQHMTTGKMDVFDMDDGFLSVLDRVIRVPCALEMVPIVGMGGIGKTTLAQRVFDYPLTCHHFYIRAWVVVSQVYQVRDILIGLLSCINQITDEIYRKSNGQLAEELYRSLKCKRFLIVLDNVRSTKAWDDVKRYFPDDKNGSRIVLTTRLQKVADYVNPIPRQPHHYVKLLDIDQSWKLLQQKVFGEEPCPVELEDIGRRIARKCQGLPLAIVIIAGILSKILRTCDCWQGIAESVSLVLSNNPEHCLEVIALSYNHLPCHLKTCFIYMGAFPEDHEIEVPKLINLWIAEGFLGKALKLTSEDVKRFLMYNYNQRSLFPDDACFSMELEAEAYLEELINRNLVLVGKRSFSGKIKTCRLHDLVSNLCLREAQKEKFMLVMERDSETFPASMADQRRLSLHSNIFDNLNSLPQMTLARSFLYFNLGFHSIADTIFFQLGFKLLRVLDIVFLRFQYFPLQILQLVQLRYLAFTATFDLPISISKLKNLCTLIIHGPWIHSEHGESPTLLFEYWNMPWLRHLHTSMACYLTNPFIAKKNLCTPWRPRYLHSLSAITFSSCSEEVFSLMPFLKKLGIFESEEDYKTDISSKWLSNLVHLEGLESLECSFYVKNGSPRNNLHWLLPSSLKKLTLSWSYVSWRNMTPVAMLSNLEVLKLKNHAFQGQEWKPSKEGFRRLKHLLIENHDLVHLEASRIEFPCLEHLALSCCESLEEIPFSIAEIPTLQLIELHYCSESAENSAKEIQEHIDGVNVDIRSATC